MTSSSHEGARRAPTRIVVAGVSGAGKSTVGRALAARLDRPFVDADDLHPESNVAKMRAGVPLEESDRLPWLGHVAAWLAGRPAGVVACSALRRSHRDLIRRHAEDTWVLLLDGDPALLRRRQAEREQHFMPPQLMASQLQTFEPLQADEPGWTADVALTVPEIVEGFLAAGRG
ncbi:MAG: gluconokinase, GntK/IdnK-type [Nocardioides sp.]